MSAEDIVDRAAAVLRELVDDRPSDDLSRARDEALLRRARLAGRSRNERRKRIGPIVGATVGGALAAAAVAGLWLFPRDPAPPDRVAEHEPPAPTQPHAPAAPVRAVRINRLDLGGGSRFLASADAGYELSNHDGVRLVRLESGAMLYILAPLADDERFMVRTDHATVTVTGTIFSVEARADATAVEVFEGSVRVEDDRGVHELGAGERYGTPGAAAATLRSEGRRAADARIRESVRTAPAPDVSRPPPREPRAGAPDDARALIVEGRAEEALAMAQQHSGPGWRFVAGDALRAMRRPALAAEAYEEAADGLPEGERRQAGFLAARLHLRELGQPRRALDALAAAGVNDAGSPLRERGLALSAEALHALNRQSELREVALAYVREFPNGSRAAWMGRFVDASRR